MTDFKQTESLLSSPVEFHFGDETMLDSALDGPQTWAFNFVLSGTIKNSPLLAKSPLSMVLRSCFSLIEFEEAARSRGYDLSSFKNSKDQALIFRSFLKKLDLMVQKSKPIKKLRESLLDRFESGFNSGSGFEGFTEELVKTIGTVYDKHLSTIHMVNGKPSSFFEFVNLQRVLAKELFYEGRLDLMDLTEKDFNKVKSKWCLPD